MHRVFFLNELCDVCFCDKSVCSISNDSTPDSCTVNVCASCKEEVIKNANANLIAV